MTKTLNRRGFETIMLMALLPLVGMGLARAADEGGAGGRLAMEIGERSRILWQGEVLAQGGVDMLAVSLVASDGERLAADSGHSVRVEGNVVTRTYAWGAIEQTYRLDGDRLDLFIGVRNTSEHTIGGGAFAPLVFTFPETPAGWGDHHSRMGHGANTPTIAEADFGSGKVVLVNEMFDQPVLFGLMWAHDHPRKTRMPVWLATWRWHGGMYAHARHLFGQRPIPPGQSDHFHFSFRFADSGTPTDAMTADVVERYRRRHPPRLEWPDRRPIGSIHIASSGSGRVGSGNKHPNNPRGWTIANPSQIDATTPEGVERFHGHLLAFASRCVENLKAADAQGMIVWNLEGEEYRHPTSYLGDPRSLPPEIDAIADAFFEVFTREGLRVGLTIRPSVPIRRAYDDRVFHFPVVDVAANLAAKIAYAKERWGCTLFYLDSNGDQSAPSDINILRRVQREHRDVLIIPEHEDPSYYGATVPFHLPGYDNRARTPQNHLTLYPEGFSVISIAHYEPEARGKLASGLQAGIARGDIMMFHAWMGKDFAETLREWYAEFAPGEQSSDRNHPLNLEP